MPIENYKNKIQYTSESIDVISDSFPARENVEHIILESDSKKAVYQKIQTLDEKTQEVINLRLTGELSFREIGDILNRNETWARVTFYRVNKNL